MSTVFFKISPTQEKEVQLLMAQEGYTNKAEFFRFLIKFFKYHHQNTEELELQKSVNELSTVLKKLKKAGKLSKSIDDQLADV